MTGQVAIGDTARISPNGPDHPRGWRWSTRPTWTAAGAFGVVALLCLALAGALGRPAIAAPGEDDTPIANPDLAPGCGVDIQVILDESGSIGSAGATGEVRQAFRAFTRALANTGSRMAVSEFSTVARLPLSDAASRDYTTVTDATIASIFDPYINNGYVPGGSTNWEDAFRIGRYFLPRPSPDRPHLVVFITDGDPNEVVRQDRVTYDPGSPNVAQNEYELKVPLESSEVQQVSNNPAKDRAVPNANALKAAGSHILTVAVGAGLSSQQSLNRIIAVSGPDVFTGTGSFDIAGDDVYRVPNFADLEDAMREAAFQLCAPSVDVRKQVDANPDPAVDDLQPGQGWVMTANVAPAPATWVLPTGASGSTATGTTGADGFLNFQWTTAAPVSSTISVSETVQSGYVNDPAATSCTYRTPDFPTDRPLPGFSATSGGFSGTVPDEAIVTCQMINRIPPAPAIELEKSTNGDDADSPTGPFVPIGDPVSWTYRVTNTGNVPLSGVAVTDSDGVAVSCPATTLAPGAETTCTAGGTATAGQYENEGTVTATGAGTQVSDTDPSHYFGVAEGIDIEKATNGADADLPPGPVIAEGGAVNWTYEVTNTGNASLSSVSVSDDQGGVAVSCPQTTLAGGASMTCTASGTASGGQYENTGSVSATGPTGPVQDSDVSHYFGAVPGVAIEKLTNRLPADTPTGPLLAVGDRVNWYYEITNTGNVPLRNWQPTDSEGVPVACPRLLLLQPDQTISCFAGGTVQAGQYANEGTVEAVNELDPTGPRVTATNPAHYFGVQGSIDLEKLTNDVDADLAPGPFIPLGAAVTWTYRVTNTGNSQLTDVGVTDLRGVTVTCPDTVLDPGEAVDCSASGSAAAGQYTNLARARGETPLGDEVQDVDPSYYYGAEPGIHLEKDTNGSDADDPADAVHIPVGAPVTWSYRVTNSGNEPLTDITVTDDKGVSVTCPAEPDPLPPGESLTCTAPAGTAVAGEYENSGSVTGTSPTGPVTDTDPSHYYGAVSGIHVEKLTNGDDADTPTGPRIPPGAAVTWTYRVTNPGNIPILNVRLADDKQVQPRFVAGDADGDRELDPSETWAYTASGTAAAGQYRNTATVTGIDILEMNLTDSDPSHYISERPPSARPSTFATSKPQPPRLVLTKRADRKRVRAGKQLRFRLRIRNAGRGATRRVSVCDRLPSGLVFASVPRGARIQGRRACYRIGTLRPRRARAFVVRARVESTERARTVCNVATRAARGIRVRRIRACVRVLPRIMRRGGGVTG